MCAVVWMYVYVGGCMYVCVSVCVSACTGALVRIHNDVVVIVCMLTCLCSRVFVIVLSVGTAGEGEQCVECLRQCAHTYGTPVGHSKASDHPVFVCPTFSWSHLLCGLQVQVTGVAASCSTVSLSFTCDTRRSTRLFCLR